MVGDGGVLPNQVPCVPQGALCVALRPCRFTNPATFSCFTQEHGVALDYNSITILTTITIIDTIPIWSDIFKATKGNSRKSMQFMQLRQLNAT